jgi:hypothetical protein
MPRARRTVLRGPSAPTRYRTRTSYSAADPDRGRSVAPHAVAVDLEAHQFRAEAHVSTAVLHVLEQHRFEVVLGDERERRRAHGRDVLGSGRTQRLHSDHGSGQHGGDAELQPDVLPGRVHALVQAPGPEDLHGPRPDAGRLREDRGARVPLDDQDADAGTGQTGGGGEAGGAGADDEDVVGLELWRHDIALSVRKGMCPPHGRRPDPRADPYRLRS